MDERMKPGNGAPGDRMLSVEEVTGSTVRDLQGEDLGKLEDLVLDAESGRVAYGILTFGGFLGIGDKYFAIPWLALRPDSKEDGFVLDVDKERLRDAPRFEKQDRPPFTDPTWSASIYEYYGHAPYWL
jgi:sporulation protein YlmC with PRC-barrel domain